MSSASERAIGLASGPVLMSGFQVVLDHSNIGTIFKLVGLFPLSFVLINIKVDVLNCPFINESSLTELRIHRGPEQPRIGT